MKTTQLLRTALDYCVLRPVLCISMAVPQGALAMLLTIAPPAARADVPKTAKVGRSVPAEPPRDQLIERPVERLRGKREPSDLDIFGARVFDEPLIPLGGRTRPAENEALARALLGYADRTDLDDFSSLTRFLDAFPDSAWRPSLLLHLGTEYYNHGRYGKALEAWEQGWKAAEPVRSGKGKAQADRLAGELARMYSRVGRMGELARLLRSLESRDLEGPATQLIDAAKGALSMMENKPDFCFKCGPLALERIQRRHNPSKTHHAAIIDARSGTNGFSLVEVAKLSRVTEMNYQMAYRSPGAAFVVPAVVHWNVGHFAAIVEREEDTGRFLAQDDTFGNSVYITPAALEAEGSGYFLVPPGPLPKGWRAVSEDEGRRIWGKGYVDGAWPNATTRFDTRCRPCDPNRPAAAGGSQPGSAPGDDSFSPYEPGTISVASPPDFSQPMPPFPDKPPPGWSGGGGGGSLVGVLSGAMPKNPPGGYMPAGRRGMAGYDFHALLASLTVDDTPVGYNPPVGPPVQFTTSYHQREAGQPATFSYSNLGPKWTCNWLAYITDNPNNPNADVRLYVDGGGTLDFSGFNPATQSYRVEVMSQARLVKLGPANYELQFANGSKQQFSRSDGAAGSTRRVFMTRIMDSAGNAVALNYDSQLRITNIVDAIGQATTLLYTNTAFSFAITSVTDPFGRSAHFQYNATGLLTQITDVIGITSQFAYGANQFLNALTTPYGTTTFSTGNVPGAVNSSMFVQATDPLGQTERVEFSQGTGGLPHYLPNSEVPRGLATFNRFIEGRNSFYWDKKAYAEGAGDYSKARNYHWVHYVVNSAAPIMEMVKQPLQGRIWFNYPGQPTNFGAPYYLNSAYAGAMNKPSIVARLLDDDSTQISTYEYNALGNVTKAVDPVGRTFSYLYDTNNVDLLEVRMTRNGKNELLGRATYNAQHLPLTITDASGQTTTNAYNGRGQLVSTTNPLGQTSTLTYDTNGYLRAASGPTPEASNQLTFTYDALGRMRTMALAQSYTVTQDYDALDRLTQVTYPDSSFEQFVYDRLDLGAIRDRLGRWSTNTYNGNRQLVETRDPLGRVYRFSWCGCGSPESFTDPMGRTTTWQYDLNGRVTSRIYPDGSAVSFEYEQARGLLKAKRDEKGQRTVFEYYPDNSLKSVTYLDTTVPTPGVFLTYDSDYTRVLKRQDGAGLTEYSYYPIDSVPVIGAGTLRSVSGPLPNSTITYQYDALGRVASRSINGIAETFTFDALGRPTTINNALGTFRYEFLEGTTELASVGYPNGQTNRYTYYDDAGDRRLKQIAHLKPDGSVLSASGYAYDAFGRIRSWTNQWDTLPSRVWSFDYDAAGQLTSAVRTQGGAPIAAFDYAYDAAGNRTSVAANGATNHFEYNPLNQVISGEVSLSGGINYEWDGANRLTAINQGSRRTEFSYDGLHRRIRIVEKDNNAVLSDTRFLWCDQQMCEMRDANGAVVSRRFFAQGESIVSAGGTTNLYYTRDHLGSIREVTDSAGVLRSRLDYDPYGQPTILSDGITPTFAFTGHFWHQPSGLHLALYRGLDPGLGRWLNRDPILEAGGFNVYQYAFNDPIDFMDPTGAIIPLLIAAAAVIAKASVGAAAVGAVAGMAAGGYVAVQTGETNPYIVAGYVAGGGVLGAAAGAGLYAGAIALGTSALTAMGVSMVGEKATLGAIVVAVTLRTKDGIVGVYRACWRQ